MERAVEIYRSGQLTKVPPYMHLPGSRSRSTYLPAQPYLQLDGADLEHKLLVSCLRAAWTYTIAYSSNRQDGAEFARVIASLVTAQNSCPVHEQCDSSCTSGIGVGRYRLMPDGEKRDEEVLRAQLAAVNLSEGTVPLERTEPLAISEDVPVFTHSPLARPESMIRLFKLKRWGFFEPILSTVKWYVLTLARLRPYGPVSYCWGPPPDDRKFVCNGKVWSGWASLESALKRLRAAFRPGDREEYICGGALCINQQNLVEKGSQISLMERIYSSAATVHIDLGDTEGYEVSVGGFTHKFGASGSMGAQDTLTQSDDMNHHIHYKTAFQALNQPWFTRRWIIQEFLLARRAKYMFQGNVFTQEYLDSILSRDAMQSNPARVQELVGNSIAMRGFLNYCRLQQIKNLSEKLDSLWLIQLTRDFSRNQSRKHDLWAVCSPCQS